MTSRPAKWDAPVNQGEFQKRVCKRCHRNLPLPVFKSDNVICIPCERGTPVSNYYRKSPTKTTTVKGKLKRDLYKRQRGKCVICEKVLPHWKDRLVHLDHNHKNKRYRGVLCANCNYGIGHFMDSVKILKRAIYYIERDGFNIEVGEYQRKLGY